MLSHSYPICLSIDEQQKHIWECVMIVKNMGIEVEVEYLQKAARERGVARAKFVRLLIEESHCR